MDKMEEGRRLSDLTHKGTGGVVGKHAILNESSRDRVSHSAAIFICPQKTEE